MTRIRYLGGGLGRMPSSRRTCRLTKPRGFFSPESSVSRASSVPMPPPPPPPMPMICLLRRVSGSSPARRVQGPLGEPPLHVVRQVGEAVAAAGLPGGRCRCGAAAAREVRAALGQRAAAAERVRLVEEHDHPAVPQGEPAQLPEQPLDLEDADAHEHVDERARVDEHVRAAGLARHRLGHQRLAGARRPPEQDAARHVAAPGLDLLRVLQVEDVLLDPLQHVVLAPHVGEPGLDVVREVHVHAAPGQEPEQRGELDHDEDDAEHELEHERQRRARCTPAGTAAPAPGWSASPCRRPPRSRRSRRPT